MSKSITQDMAYRQSLMKYAEKYGVSRASRKYNKSRSYIYFWKQRWDGSVASLGCQSRRRPHGYPNQHTEAELKLIRDMRRRNPTLWTIELWHRLRGRGYTRCPESLFRVMRRLGMFPDPKPKKDLQTKALRANDPSRRARPSGCKGRPSQLYCRPGASPVSVHCHRRVHAAALSRRLSGAINLLLSGFSSQADGMVRTPRHNGKVERSHREDQKRFYSCHDFYSLDDFAKQLAVHHSRSNNFPMRPLHWLSPIEFIVQYV